MARRRRKIFGINTVVSPSETRFLKDSGLLGHQNPRNFRLRRLIYLYPLIIVRRGLIIVRSRDPPPPPGGVLDKSLEPWFTFLTILKSYVRTVSYNARERSQLDTTCLSVMKSLENYAITPVSMKNTSFRRKSTRQRQKQRVLPIWSIQGLKNANTPCPPK